MIVSLNYWPSVCNQHSDEVIASPRWTPTCGSYFWSTGHASVAISEPQSTWGMLNFSITGHLGVTTFRCSVVKKSPTVGALWLTQFAVSKLSNPESEGWRNPAYPLRLAHSRVCSQSNGTRTEPRVWPFGVRTTGTEASGPDLSFSNLGFMFVKVLSTVE